MAKKTERGGKFRTAGSATVFVNKKPAARIGDAVSIGGTVQDGSGNVRIGG